MKRILGLTAILTILTLSSGCGLFNKAKSKVPGGGPDLPGTPSVPDGGDIAEAGGKAGKATKAAIDQVSNWNDSQEQAMGAGIALDLANHYGGVVTLDGVPDEHLHVYVNRVANAVAVHGKRKDNPGNRGADRRFVVGVLNTKEINAFSTPGGYIFVTRGMLMKLRNEAQLAYVLAHEVAHVDREHGLDLIKAQMGVGAGLESVASSASSGASDLLDSPEFYDKLAGLFIDALLKTGFSKKAEFTADADAVAMMKKAGYDPAGAKAVLQMLGANEQGAKTIFSTHPPPAKRLEALGDTLSGGGKTFPNRYEAVVRIQLASK